MNMYNIWICIIYLCIYILNLINLELLKFIFHSLSFVIFLAQKKNWIELNIHILLNIVDTLQNLRTAIQHADIR